MKKFIILAVAALVTVLLFYGPFYKGKEKQYKIAVLNYSPAADAALEGLLAGLRSRGYTKENNLEVIYSGFIRDKELLKQEAKRLVGMNPDIIYTMSTPATLAAKHAAEGTDIPVVFGPVSSPVQVGIVDQMKHPGGNITGVTFGPQEPRRFETLVKLKPDTKRVLVAYNPNDQSPQVGLDELKPVAKRMGAEIVLLEIRSEKELLERLNSFTEPVDAFFVPTDSMMVAHIRTLAEYAVQKRIPLTCPQQEGVYAGALFSYGFSLKDLGYQASRIVHMILSGTKPGEIPVEISDFQITINISTAEKIGLDIPEYLISNSLIIRH